MSFRNKMELLDTGTKIVAIEEFCKRILELLHSYEQPVAYDDISKHYEQKFHSPFPSAPTVATVPKFLIGGHLNGILQVCTFSI